ncbi:hypothetical protein N7466_000524 [Penicillium verhagenii]|uniref:uncharacterized protein n=1 Tax=Penicillium verhagenii TaxID=1562060 RepID=UPI002545865B|nr:uncharacterized protein N7466_000524 [Penicillium verhagenii]KAJ5947509.1 hypothetical protein N7466_000524 [Penicillium verhagenii]
MNSASQGEKALAESNAPLAIQHFTRALSELPRAPAYYIHRSTAYSRLKPADGGPNRTAALRDAEIAVFLAHERGKRELILSAQMRRGIILFQLERYGDAHFIFEQIEAKTGGPPQPVDKSQGIQSAMAGGWTKKDGYSAELPIWMMKVRRKLSELEGDEKTVVSVLEYPTDIHVPTEKELKAEWERLKSGKSDVEKSPAAQPASGAASSSTETKMNTSEQNTASNVVAPAAEKVRHEWYQSQDSVVVTLYVKNVQKDKVETELKGDSISLQFPLPSGSEYDFTLDPLYASIDASASKVTVMGTKIEIVLQKQTPGQKWNALEAPAGATKLTDRPSAPAASVPVSSGPAYPTSSRHGAKDWDKVASSLTAKNSKENKSKDAKDTADGDDSDAESVNSDFGGDAVDGFFKKLYAGADADTRRAMMKSYVESNGTSLSTNWSEVGTKKMEPHPPS